MSKLICASPVVLPLVLALGCASAGEHPWSYSAAAAIPTDNAIRNDLFDKKNGRLLFQDGKTGNAAFFCPVTHFHGRYIQSLELTYRDGDGRRASGGTVTATLKRVRRFDGAVQNILSVKSDGPGSAGDSGPAGWSTRTTLVLGGPSFKHDVDLEGFY